MTKAEVKETLAGLIEEVFDPKNKLYEVGFGWGWTDDYFQLILTDNKFKVNVINITTDGMKRPEGSTDRG